MFQWKLQKKLRADFSIVVLILKSLNLSNVFHSHKKGRDFDALYTWNVQVTAATWWSSQEAVIGQIWDKTVGAVLNISDWPCSTFRPCLWLMCYNDSFTWFYNWGQLFFVINNQQGPTTIRWATEWRPVWAGRWPAFSKAETQNLKWSC